MGIQLELLLQSSDGSAPVARPLRQFLDLNRPFSAFSCSPRSTWSTDSTLGCTQLTFTTCDGSSILASMRLLATAFITNNSTWPASNRTVSAMSMKRSIRRWAGNRWAICGKGVRTFFDREINVRPPLNRVGVISALVHPSSDSVPAVPILFALCTVILMIRPKLMNRPGFSNSGA